MNVHELWHINTHFAQSSYVYRTRIVTCLVARHLGRHLDRHLARHLGRHLGRKLTGQTEQDDSRIKNGTRRRTDIQAGRQSHRQRKEKQKGGQVE